MYILLVAWSITAVFSATVDNDGDGTGLLQAKLMQERGGNYRSRKDKYMSKAAYSGECKAAQTFCTKVIQEVSSCQGFWQKKESSCSEAFCNVKDALQTFESKEVLVHHYKDAAALRGACKTFVRGLEWGENRKTCPDEITLRKACRNPTRSDRIEQLKMATFCDELEYMCDAWAMWFIEAAGRQDEQEYKYSCKAFAADNAEAWNEAPGGCEKGMAFGWGEVVGEENTAPLPQDDEGSVETDAADSDETTQNWESISDTTGCAQNHDSEKFNPLSVEEFQNDTLQECFARCTRHRWCMAIDYEESTGTCELFDWACESPVAPERRSFRLHRGDAGASRKRGGKLDCDKDKGWRVIQGIGTKWDCPDLLSAYTDAEHGCLLPEGPLAQCVCDYNWRRNVFTKASAELFVDTKYVGGQCQGITTVYDSNFRRAHGTKKKLVGRGFRQNTTKLNDVSYTCKKLAQETNKTNTALAEETMVEAASHELNARASASADLSGAADALLDTTVKRKGCIAAC